MRTPLFLLLLLPALLLGACGSPQLMRLTVPSRDSVPSVSVALDDYERRYPGVDAVYLDNRVSLEYYGNPGAVGATQIVRRKYVVLNPDAEWTSTVELRVRQGESLSGGYFVVHNSDGTRRYFGLTDLKEEARGNTRVFKLAYPDIRKGSVVEEAFEMKVNPILTFFNHYFPLQGAVPYEHLELEVMHPKFIAMRLKRIGPNQATRGLSVQLDKDLGRWVMRYRGDSIPALGEEIYSPYFNEYGNYLQAMVVEGIDGIYFPEDWTTLGSFMGMTPPRYVMRKYVDETVQQLTAGMTTQRQKADTILKYVQATVKLGPGPEDPQDYATMLRRHNATSYQICQLTRIMLTRARIEASNLLIHDAREGFFDPDFISPDQLSVPAVMASVDSTKLLMFPYDQNLPAGQVPNYLQGQPAWELRETKQLMITTPVAPDTANTTSENYTLVVDDDGKLTVTEERSYTGSAAYAMRDYLDELGEEDSSAFDRKVRDLVSYTDGTVTMQKYAIDNRHDLSRPLVLRFDYTIDNLVTVTPEEAVMQTGGLFSPSTQRKKKIITENRRQPIRIYASEQMHKVVTIRTPPSWSLSTPVPVVDYTNQLGAISSTTTAEGNQVTIEQHRTLNKASRPKGDAGQLLAVTGTRSKLAIPTMVFSIRR